MSDSLLNPMDNIQERLIPNSWQLHEQLVVCSWEHLDCLVLHWAPPASRELISDNVCCHFVYLNINSDPNGLHNLSLSP